MENKLEIRKDASGRELRIFLEGRLDANWAGHLDDYLNNLVREGSHRLILNMKGVQYLSSAGIRILIGQFKKIKKIGGLFVLEDLSSPVSEVLDMVGMISLLTEGAPESVPVEKTGSKFTEINGYRFENDVLSKGLMTLRLTGDPALALNSGFTSADNRKIKFSADHYGLGIGAIGDGFDDCKSRYGEFLAIGETLVYKPSDGSKIPDYAIKTGKFDPEINALFSIEAEGSFANRISFEPDELHTSVSFEDLVTGLSGIAGYTEFVFLIIAECDGLVGASLNAPPVEGRKLFEFPAIRDTINFTTEPAYARMLSVSLGLFSQNPDEKMKTFLRPLRPDSTAFVHTHTAVFPFQALSKNETSAGKLVLHLIENSIVQDVFHLIHDSREITGIGSSSFKQGVAWVAKCS